MTALDQISSLTDNERAALADYLTQLHETCGDRLLQVILFGSKARGDSEPESDIDLLVVLRGELDGLKDRLADLSYRISLYYGVVLSDFVAGERRHRWMSQHHEPLLVEAEREGIELWRNRSAELLSLTV
jgi:predicted nucleotidyltransferase